MPRRLKKNRKRGKEESPKRMRSGGVRCKGCDEFGHNIRTCPRGAGSSSRRPKKEKKAATNPVGESAPTQRTVDVEAAAAPSSQPVTTSAPLYSN
ncbi:hypothetical protein JRO89_XSUnG0175600 [Xanthoceras sorbifolium]|uniref:CCHC-type domain-containing protein n=1 Tax=Xanthoceras sorbifolium TaxID=99658 RepID=A0ABQ8GXK1_9ROSI|nr:hypothetical protein JRO89_XSUnG0175600 [Xanthoceras sorbifolium]